MQRATQLCHFAPFTYGGTEQFRVECYALKGSFSLSCLFLEPQNWRTDNVNRKPHQNVANLKQKFWLILGKLNHTLNSWAQVNNFLSYTIFVTKEIFNELSWSDLQHHLAWRAKSTSIGSVPFLCNLGQVHSEDLV